ncbi:MAG: gephyrin-like molybdotransferase Glp [Gemmatimonadales bacterium]
MIPIDEARSLLAGAVKPLAPVSVDLRSALGCRLSSAVRSDVNVPPADVSAMDGYAVRHADLAAGRPLPVFAEVAAGDTGSELAPGAVARIFTGAPLPLGADTVVPQEHVETGGDGRVTLEPCIRGAHVRRRGEVVTAGAEIFAAGAWVTPQMLSVMASCGASRIDVVPAPSVAVVVTGAEIVDAATTPEPYQIRDSNGPLLTALAAAARFEISCSARAADTKEALHEALSRAVADADLVLTTGGVSVGDYDLVPDIVAELGGEVLFHRVRIKPGKPLLAARIGSKLLLGLPGNPLAVLAGWRLFAWPAAAALAGDDEAFSETPVEAGLGHPAATPANRTELRPAFLRAAVGGPSVELIGWRGSHDVSAAARANALARFDPECEYPEGSRIPCYPLSTADPRPGKGWRSPS